MSITVDIIDRQSNQLVSVDQIQLDDPKVTVGYLKGEIKRKLNIDVLRQRLNYGEILLDNDNATLKQIGVKNGDKILFKDLGAQILWQNVFYIEYFGPILVFSIIFFWNYENNRQSLIKITGYTLAFSHYLKRLIETAFVHVFSRDSMPFYRLFINCFHYWILFGVFIGLELFQFRDVQEFQNEYLFWALFGLFFVFEFFNLQCHLTLSSIRRDYDQAQNFKKVRQIPYGWGFNQVSCANYFWEVCIWITFSIIVRCYTAYFFTFVSTIQMMIWAKEKHVRYQKEFIDFPRGRKAMIPFIF